MRTHAAALAISLALATGPAPALAEDSTTITAPERLIALLSDLGHTAQLQGDATDWAYLSVVTGERTYAIDFQQCQDRPQRCGSLLFLYGYAAATAPDPQVFLDWNADRVFSKLVLGPDGSVRVEMPLLLASRMDTDVFAQVIELWMSQVTLYDERVGPLVGLD